MPRSAIALALLAASGCIVYDSGPSHSDEPVEVVDDYPVNYAPLVTWGAAGCYYDSYYHDDIWYFEADVDNPDSPYDVIAVYADVYDAYTDTWVDSFELYASQDPYFWYSDWLGSSTWLDCHYGGYVVDLVAYDSFDAYDLISIYPETYGH